MPLAVVSSTEVQDRTCDVCGKLRKRLLRVHERRAEIVFVCLGTPEQPKSCFFGKYPHSVVDCGEWKPDAL